MINNKFGWNAYSVLEYFYLKQSIPIPPYLNRKIPEKVKKEALKPYPSGSCYLININEALLNAKNGNDLYVYLELASKRHLFDYLMRGVPYLHISLVPEYLLGWIDNNPLLEIENNKVYFKYEQE